jgi:DNA-binding response OmpR family regulator
MSWADDSTHNGRERILVIEDDSASHEVLRKLLLRWGFDVLSAMTVAGADALLREEPDFVILDLMLPDGEGERILERIRSEGLPTRVFVASAVCDADRLDRVRSLRPDAVFTKPISASELRSYLSAPVEQ